MLISLRVVGGGSLGGTLPTAGLKASKARGKSSAVGDEVSSGISFPLLSLLFYHIMTTFVAEFVLGERIWGILFVKILLIK